MQKELMYKLSADDVIIETKSKRFGLDVTEAENRLAEEGLNKLPEAKKKSYILKFIDQMKNIMIIILIVAAIISFVTAKIENESVTESLIIFAVVILNAILGVFQESKAEKAIDALKKMSLPYIKVRRNGEVMSVKTEELVVGDICLVEAGDFVPADMRIIENNSLRADEAALTGESVPANKQDIVYEKDTPLAERRNMLYSGSSIVYGRGEGVVVATGEDTELGKIAKILTETKEELTPLQRKLNEISKVLSILVVIIGLFMVITGLLKHNPILEIFMLAVSLAVAAIPEGLPASITVILSIGVEKMAKKNSIVRKLSSVETLGATEIICSDKTGTLTQNKMTVTKFAISNKVLQANEISEDMIGINEVKKFVKAMLLCNDVKETEEGAFLGDPTEIALVKVGEKFGLSKRVVDIQNRRVAEVPFDSNRKMMTTINLPDDEIKYMVCTKGAIESIVSRCSKIYINGETLKFTKELKEKVLETNKEMSKSALRVLGIAYKEIDKIPDEVTSENIEDDLTYLGLTGMIDPPREEVFEAVKKCFASGMTPIMITGDNIDTASAIAKEIGILKDKDISITGADLDNMTEDEFINKIHEIKVYARVSPENKVRIVNTWKKLGKTVAMTGDGVNDAPAIKSADIGIGMGITGTEVSKSVASMVLADDNFATIVIAIEEGRRIYKNIQNVIAYLLASNLAEVLIVFIATLFSKNIFNPLQLLWINLISDTIPAITLGFEKAEKNIMNEKPRNANEKFFNNFLTSRIVVAAIIKSIMVLGLYFIIEASPIYTHEQAMTCSFISLTFIELLFAVSIRSDRKSVLSLGVFSNMQMFIGILITIVLQLVVIFVPNIANILSLEMLTPRLYSICFAIPVIYFFIAEITKIVLAKKIKKV